jgi:hypothetical protein
LRLPHPSLETGLTALGLELGLTITAGHINSIAAMTTRTGPTVRAELDTTACDTVIRVGDRHPRPRANLFGLGRWA